jgi:hypothetical protein
MLERLGIPYLAAGALASSVHGEPRSTNDVELVVDLAAGHVPGLLRAFGDRLDPIHERMVPPPQRGRSSGLRGVR